MIGENKIYGRHSAVRHEWAQELIGELYLRGQEAALDIGYGDGRVKAAIAFRLARGRAVGIDSSPSMIAEAQESYPLCRNGNLAFQLMDALAIQFEDPFGMAFSRATLDPEPLLEAFISDIVERYDEMHPKDSRGWVRVKMVRLEVEAVKP